MREDLIDALAGQLFDHQLRADRGVGAAPVAVVCGSDRWCELRAAATVDKLHLFGDGSADERSFMGYPVYLGRNVCGVSIYTDREALADAISLNRLRRA